MSGTPSATGAGVSPETDVLDPERLTFMAEQFTPRWSAEERRSPEFSPMYAELHGLPSALFTVGTGDHLLDDTLFFSQRWSVAGSQAELLVYPDAPHACIGLPTVLGHWWPRLEAFLQGCIQQSR